MQHYVHKAMNAACRTMERQWLVIIDYEALRVHKPPPGRRLEFRPKSLYSTTPKFLPVARYLPGLQQLAGMSGFPLFYWQKNPGLFQDFPGPPREIFQDLFGAHERLNIKKKRNSRPRGSRTGWGSLAGSSEPPPHQLGGLGERCKLPVGFGAKPQKIWNLVQFEMSKFTTEMH